MKLFERISVYDADEIIATFADAKILEYSPNQKSSKCLHPRGSLLSDQKVKSLVKNEDKQTPLILYSLNGDATDDIAQMFGEFGFCSSYSVNGGYAAWQNQVIDRFKIRDKLRHWLKTKGFDQAIYNVNNRVDQEKRTALMHAARRGQADIVRELLAAGADPNYTDRDGNAALWYACLAGSLPCVKALINADAEVDNLNFRGFTALDYSVGHEPIARTIVESYQLISFNM